MRTCCHPASAARSGRTGCGTIGLQGWFHNFWFTTEIRTTFHYTGPISIDVAATDDLFVYINGKLVADLGGTHQHIPAHVAVEFATATATIVEGGRLATVTGLTPACPGNDPYTTLTTNAQTNTDGNGHSNCTIADCDCRTRTVDLGLQPGRSYELAIFAANRHSPQYDLNILAGLPNDNMSACAPRCGDGVRTGGEQCDCGDSAATASTDPWCNGMANINAYGGCATDCRFAGSCGNGFVDAGEQCDRGALNNTGRYGDATGCTPGCRWARVCGDGMLDAYAGETCDLGPNNGAPAAKCDIDCRVRP